MLNCLQLFADRSNRKRLTWSRRISAAIGVARGIQFLHTGILPGVFTNNIKITDILLDQNLVAKIGSHNLPVIAQNIGKVLNSYLLMFFFWFPFGTLT